VAEAAEPHAGRGRAVAVVLRGTAGSPMPAVARRPEIVHGLRNLIQNAVDFARTEVRIEVDWTADRIVLRISDDGPGFPPPLLGRIGEPWLRDRRSPARPGYDGMGLGLFIAKTLLERTRARIGFANARDDDGRVTGAVATVDWARRDIERDPNEPLGDNPPMEAAGVTR